MGDHLSTLLLEGFMKRNFDAWYASLAADFIASYPNARRGLNKDAARGYNEAYLSLMSDARFEYTGSATSGDTTFTRWILRGTHDGPLALEQFKSAKPTGKRISWPGVLVVQIAGDEIVREEMFWNQVELLDVLGLL